MTAGWESSILVLSIWYKHTDLCLYLSKKKKNKHTDLCGPHSLVYISWIIFYTRSQLWILIFTILSHCCLWVRGKRQFWKMFEKLRIRFQPKHKPTLPGDVAKLVVLGAMFLFCIYMLPVHMEMQKFICNTWLPSRSNDKLCYQYWYWFSGLRLSLKLFTSLRSSLQCFWEIYLFIFLSLVKCLVDFLCFVLNLLRGLSSVWWGYTTVSVINYLFHLVRKCCASWIIYNEMLIF